jgi:hypothetical protein
MRSDMFKLIVEAPRRGHNQKSDGRIFRNSEEAPAKLGMRAGYRSRKWLNENLNPLERYLHAQIGRPWDKVYSEICRTIDGRSTVKQHVLLHIEDFVVVRTKLVEGIVVTLHRGWLSCMPLEDVDTDLYVHPVSGLLLRNRAYARKCEAGRQSRRRQAVADAADRRVLDAERQLHRIDGIWYLVDVEALPEERYVKSGSGATASLRPVYDKRWDVVRKAMVAINHDWVDSKDGQPSNQTLYGDIKLFGVSKRQLDSRELRDYGLASK